MATKRNEPPVVKMNLATKLRMERNNPILNLTKEIERLKQNASIIDSSNLRNDTLSGNKSKPYSKPVQNVIKSKIDNRPPSYMKTIKELPKNSNEQKPNEKKSNILPRKSTINYVERNKMISKTHKKPGLINVIQNVGRHTLSINTVKRRRSYDNIKNTKEKNLTNNKNIKTKTDKPIVKTNVDNNKRTTDKNENEKPRRSLSAVHFKKIKTNDINEFIRRSTENLSSKKKQVNIRTPIAEEPEFTRRRSVTISTPGSVRKNTFVTPKYRPTNTALDLQSRLNSWLESKGKPIGSYHHLTCFGIHILPSLEKYNEEDKENFEVIEHKTSSYEDLSIKTKNNCITDTHNLLNTANDALHDLHKLIMEGYPRESCEAWLHLIKSKFKQLEDQPQYWECRAALEETRGNFTSAIDCYQQAIIKGAEVKNVDESLDQLLKKFEVLNLTPAVKKPLILEDNQKNRRKTIIEARNVFKSTIINFAVQEKKLKTRDEEEKGYQFFATPVRRSTRLSRSTKYTSTPGVKLCTTLNELDEDTRKSMCFRNNKALAL